MERLDSRRPAPELPVDYEELGHRLWSVYLPVKSALDAALTEKGFKFISVKAGLNLVADFLADKGEYDPGIDVVVSLTGEFYTFKHIQHRISVERLNNLKLSERNSFDSAEEVKRAVDIILQAILSAYNIA